MAAPLPSPADIARAERFTRERFVHEGEDPAEALGAGSARRRALDDALAEIAQGHDHPSTEWRRAYSLLLGLERLLSEEEPHLVDGTLLNPHQVDALSGTLTALLAEAQRNGAPPAPAGSNGAAPQAAAVSTALPGEEEDESEELPDDEEPQDWVDDVAEAEDDDAIDEAPEDPNAHKRFWFEHATGAGKSVAALGFVEASRTGGVLILTHRRNLVDQFLGELRERGYSDRIAAPLMKGDRDPANGPVTVETYQWFVRNAGKISSTYTIVICDEAHTALGEKTSAAIREWTGPIFIGMTATGALIARHVTDLFPTQTSRFDLAQAARRGVIAPLRCIRIPPGAGVRSIAKVPLRRGDVDVEFDQEALAELLDQLPFNLAVANLYKTRFNGVPGVVYAAGVRHAYNVASAFRDEGLKAVAVSGETPKRELADILARYERGDIDVLVNAQLLAEGWNSPRATVCMHLAPTASKRIYQQRVGRVTRRHPGKESGLVVDFVHPATKHDDPVVTLHSLLDRDVYRGGAIVVGPVRRGRGRRVRVERRVLPVTADPDRRAQVFERELWRIAVEHLDWGEQHVWAALAGARVQPTGWRRARAMLHFDRTGELKRRFLLTAVQRNRNGQLRVRALQEIAAAKDAEAFDLAIDEIGTWSREERREAVKVCLQALAEKRIGRRDQANAWIWRLAEYTREVHEEYAVQRWPETKRLLGLLVNSSGGAHARNARRLVHASRKQDRRLSAALLAAALAHTPEAEEVLRGARTRMARKPSSLSRELLRNFPKRRTRGTRKRRRKDGEPELVDAVLATAGAAGEGLGPPGDDEFDEVDDVLLDEDGDGFDDAEPAETLPDEDDDFEDDEEPEDGEERVAEAARALPALPPPSGPRRVVIDDDEPPAARRPRRRRSSSTKVAEAAAEVAAAQAAPTADAVPVSEEKPKAATRRRAAAKADDGEAAPKATTRRRAAAAKDDDGEAAPKATTRRRAAAAKDDDGEAAPKTTTRRRAAAKVKADEVEAAAEAPSSDGGAASPVAAEEAAPKATTRRRAAVAKDDDGEAAPKATTRRRAAAKVKADEVEAAAEAPSTDDAALPVGAEEAPPKTTRRRAAAKAKADDVVAAGAAQATDGGAVPAPDADAPKPRTRRRAVAATAEGDEAAPKTTRRRAATKAKADDVAAAGEAQATDGGAVAAPDEDAPKPRTRRRAAAAKADDDGAEAKPATRRRAAAAAKADDDGAEAKPATRRRRAAAKADEPQPADVPAMETASVEPTTPDDKPKPRRRATPKKPPPDTPSSGEAEAA